MRMPGMRAEAATVAGRWGQFGAACRPPAQVPASCLRITARSKPSLRDPLAHDARPFRNGLNAITTVAGAERSGRIKARSAALRDPPSPVLAWGSSHS